HHRGGHLGHRSFSSCGPAGHGPRLEVPAAASRIVLVQTSGARSCGLRRGLLGGLRLALGDLLLAHGTDVTALLDRRGGGRMALDLHGGATALSTRGDAPRTALAVRTAPEAALLAARAPVGLLPVLLVALAGAGGPVPRRPLDAGLGDLGGEELDR